MILLRVTINVAFVGDVSTVFFFYIFPLNNISAFNGTVSRIGMHGYDRILILINAAET